MSLRQNALLIGSTNSSTPGAPRQCATTETHAVRKAAQTRCLAVCKQCARCRDPESHGGLAQVLPVTPRIRSWDGSMGQTYTKQREGERTGASRQMRRSGCSEAGDTSHRSGWASYNQTSRWLPPKGCRAARAPLGHLPRLQSGLCSGKQRGGACGI